MTRAYLFNWMETLGYLDNSNNEKDIRELITDEEHDSLLINKLEESEIPEEKRLEVQTNLSRVDLFLYDDSEEIISELKSEGLAVVSNMYEIISRRVRSLFPDFIRNFNVLAFSAELSLKKPNPKIFYHTLAELNKITPRLIVPHGSIMVGSKWDKDIKPALEMGMRAKIINRTKQNLKEVIDGEEIKVEYTGLDFRGMQFLKNTI